MAQPLARLLFKLLPFLVVHEYEQLRLQLVLNLLFMISDLAHFLDQLVQVCRVVGVLFLRNFLQQLIHRVILHWMHEAQGMVRLVDAY